MKKKLLEWLPKQTIRFYLESGQVIKVRCRDVTCGGPGTWSISGLRGRTKRPVYMTNVVAVVGRRAPWWWPFS